MGTMVEKTVDVEIEVEDCTEFLKGADSHTQMVFLYQIAKLYWNKPSQFNMQLQFMADELQELSHDTQIIIRDMVDKVQEYLGTQGE